MNFDIRTVEAARETISIFIDISKVDLINMDFEKFWQQYGVECSEFDLKDVTFSAYHLTTSIDECNEIKVNGLKNLQYILTENTILKNMCAEKGILFDLNEKVITHPQGSYSLDYNFNDFWISEEEKRIPRRIFKDYAINGFLYTEDIKNYNPDMLKSPEFLNDLSRVLPQSLASVKRQWEENSRPYQIDFTVTLCQIHQDTFDIDDMNQLEPFSDDTVEKIKKSMLKFVFDRINYSKEEQFLYLKDNASVAADQITAVHLLD